MPTSCNPADRGEQWNQVTQEDGPILIDVRFGWDGVSTLETGCNGPVDSIRVRNTGTVAWYANLPNKKRGGKSIEIPPGTDTTLRGGELTSLGLTTYADVQGVGLSPTPLA